MKDVIARSETTGAERTLLEDEIDPMRYLLMAWRFRWLILAVTVASGAVAFVAGRSVPPSYEATVRLLATTGRPTEAGTTLNLAGFRLLLDSQTLGETVVREFRLDAPPLALTPQRFLQQALTLEPVTGSNILTLRVRLADRTLPPKVANRAAELLTALADRLRQDDTARARDETKRDVDQARARLDAAEQQLVVFRKQSQIEALRQDVETQLTQRGELLPLLVEIQSEKARLAKAEEQLAQHQRIDSVKRTIVSDPVLTEAAREQAPKGGSSLLGLGISSEYVNQVYADLDKDVAELRAKVSALERRKTELVDARKLDAAQLPALNNLYEREAQLSRLETEQKLAGDLYLEAASRYEKVRLQVQGASIQLQVLDPALSTASPVATSTTRKTLIALLLGFVGSLVLAVAAGALLEAVHGRKTEEPKGS